MDTLRDVYERGLYEKSCGLVFFFSSRRRHTRFSRDWSSDVCSSDLFCRAWVDYWKRLTGDRIDYAPYQEVGARFPNISPEQFATAAKLILPNREVRSGAHAVFTVLATASGKGSALWAYQNLPGVAAASEATYGVFARQRSFFY